jgi:MFS family permease
MSNMQPGDQKLKLPKLPRNVWAVSLTSFLMDISSEMVINILPLFLANVLGIRPNLIGLIEGVAESTSSLLKVFSGWFSDRLRARKWLAVAGYGISTLTKPFYYYANSWFDVAAVRWADRIGKGVRTAPRDALIADSVSVERRGLAFGFQRAADTAGAMLGLIIASGVIWWSQSSAQDLSETTFRKVVLVSLIPAVLAVLVLAIGAQDIPVEGKRQIPKFALRSMGRPFITFLFIVGLFELGNSSDAFLVLRAQERGMSVAAILSMLVVFNLVYALISTPAGALSDRLGRKTVIVGGWLFYALIYIGFGLVQAAWQLWVLYALYGIYYGLSYGTAKAMVSDMVPETLRGTAYGTYNAVLGVIDLPASLIAGILWSGLGSWQGFGAAAPFIFGAGTALLSAFLLVFWLPRPSS